MATAQEIKDDLEANLDGLQLTLDAYAQSIVVAADDLLRACAYLRDHQDYQCDYLSNLTGVDYIKENYLEVVYHLYSMSRKNADPVVLKCRTGDRDKDVHLPSVVSLWRSAEYQEREVYDLFGVVFDGHPDLRRILMWDGFRFHPMRKDYEQEDQDVLGEDEEALLREAEENVMRLKGMTP